MHSAAKPSASRLAPPTSAPSTSGCAMISATFFALTDPPYRMRTRSAIASSYSVAEPLPQGRAHLLGVVRRGHLARADRPHRFVRDDDPRGVVRRHLLQCGLDLRGAVLDVSAGLPHVQPLPHAQDRGQAVPQRCRHLVPHERVVLVVVDAPLRVADRHVATAHRAQHRPRHVAGVRPLVVRRQVLRAAHDERVFACRAPPAPQREAGTAAAPRRPRAGAGPPGSCPTSLRTTSPASSGRQVHLPVARDQRSSRHVSPPQERRYRAGPCPPGTPATRRRRWRCGRTRPRTGRARGRPPPSPRHRPR